MWCWFHSPAFSFPRTIYWRCSISINVSIFFVIYQISVYEYLYLSIILNPFDLHVCFVPLLYCFYYYSFIMYLEVLNNYLSNILFTQDCLSADFSNSRRILDYFLFVWNMLWILRLEFHWLCKFITVEWSFSQ